MYSIEEWNYNIYVTERVDWNMRDNKNNLLQNFSIFEKQDHWNDIVFLEKLEDQNKLKSGDAIVTCLTSLKIAVVLADCNWIVLMWQKYFWVIHAGWKWLQNGIIQKTIKLLLDKWEKIDFVWSFVWPSIRKCCYDVWNEFYNYFDSKYLKNTKNMLYFDMEKLIYDILVKQGISKDNIIIEPYCTKCNKDNYFSFRSWDIKDRFLVWVEKKW